MEVQSLTGVTDHCVTYSYIQPGTPMSDCTPVSHCDNFVTGYID